MPRYLFTFGYETPRQRALNTQHGWDDEDSYAFFIEAPDETSALRRGVDVAEAFVHRLFERSDWDGPIPSWKEGGFAYEIERHPERFAAEQLGNLPLVSADKAPDFGNWPI